ncbi:MAG: hypothetical protein RMX96_24115 [Nostoc sp. ChiSLP02]|nr:hypothetical protein [Nostoc sp. DedSLP05]MDZ8101144.1 hypothetical protein [Nostoc sp. DedSLP01]MDZ8187922.1 hypothetical protein [Nostoc sp. ChiSLP02]
MRLRFPLFIITSKRRRSPSETSPVDLHFKVERSPLQHHHSTSERETTSSKLKRCHLKQKRSRLKQEHSYLKQERSRLEQENSHLKQECSRLEQEHSHLKRERSRLEQETLSSKHERWRKNLD